ncbi:MAG: GldG family protein, partial [Woeseiaceae bacterium]
MGTALQRNISASSFLILALAFIVAIIISNQIFSGWRIDLTENRLYTLSDGTKRILDNLGEPINLYFYYSDKATEGIPSLRGYANRVRETLEEFERAADGKIKLSVIDPLPFSEDEDRASQFGLQGINLAATPDAIYIGLAGTDSIDNEEIISFFQPDKEEFLEYDIAKLISTLANPERKVIGLISGVTMSGNFDPQTQQMDPPWVVYQQVQQLFEVRSLGTEVETIDDDVGMLWIVQPKNLNNATLYAIDQFVLQGGTAMIFVDPLAEADPAAPAQGMPPGMPLQGQSSDLAALFEAWGLKFTTTDVVADAQLALPVAVMVANSAARAMPKSV